MRRVSKAISIFIIMLIFACCLSACGGSKPSREFYINDFAGVFLEGTRDMIMLEGERLYETTKKSSIGGAKVVVLTRLVEQNETIEQKDAKEIFEDWFLGDMDILIFLAFTKDSSGITQFVSVFLNIGDKMETFISTEDAVDMVQNTVFSSQWEGNLDLGMGNFYYELLSAIYKNVYGYTTFDYNFEEYIDYIDREGVIKNQKPMGALGYIFSKHSPVWKKILVLSPIILLAVGVFCIFRAKRKI